VGSVSPATILVLEENAAVQELIDQALRESGHRVLCTKDPLEAVEVVRRVRVDVLVASAALGEARQILLSELRGVQPDLPIISICRAGDDIQKIDHNTALTSPFSLDDLREAVVAGLAHRD
jgi:DNA-binding response OmpR family regulator